MSSHFVTFLLARARAQVDIKIAIVEIKKLLRSSTDLTKRMIIILGIREFRFKRITSPRIESRQFYWLVLHERIRDEGI